MGRGLRADVDDGAARGHVVGGQGAQSQRSFEVDVDGLVEQLARDVFQRRRHRRDARVVDEHVDATELGDCGRDERGALRPITDVARHRKRVPAYSADLGGDLFASVEFAAGHDDIGTRGRKPQGHRATETFAAASDDDDFAVGAQRRNRHGRNSLAGRSMSADALAKSRSAWRPKYSWTGLLDWPRRNLA